MKPHASCFMFLAIGALAVGCSNDTEVLHGSGLLVLSGATLIDGTGSPPQENVVIVVQGERILRVGRAGQYRLPTDASILDLTGLYVTPGFIDTHVHSRALDQMGSTLLAFGITTIRSPGDDNGTEMRERLESGALVGPRLLTAGRIIDHPGNELGGSAIKLESELQVREEVRRQAAEGVDYVKVYMGIPRDLLEAIVDEAHHHNVRVIGHLHRTSWTEAAQAGIDVLVHSGSEGPIWELLEEGEGQRFPWGDFGGYLRAWAGAADRVDLQGPRMDRLVRALVDGGVEVNPTLVIMESLYWGNEPSVGARLEPAFAPATLIDGWWGHEWAESNPFMRQWNLTDGEWAQLRRGFVVTKAMVRVFHERGVLITAGSDVGMPWITPGVSFHRELELLVSSGIPPLDVLAIGTHNGARALGIADDTGTIEIGKRADILILREDPLSDIRGTRSIDSVIYGGEVLNPVELLPSARAR